MNNAVQNNFRTLSGRGERSKIKAQIVSRKRHCQSEKNGIMRILKYLQKYEQYVTLQRHNRQNYNRVYRIMLQLNVAVSSSNYSH